MTEQLDFLDKLNLPIYSVTIPVKVQSEQNIQQHWAVSNKRHQNVKLVVKAFIQIDSPKIPLPCTIKLTRIAPRELDEDNMIYGCKRIKDTIAEYIHPGLAKGRADDDKRIKWLYSQEKGRPKEYAVRIDITKNHDC